MEIEDHDLARREYHAIESIDISAGHIVGIKDLGSLHVSLQK
jgi:hypothetical protein